MQLFPPTKAASKRPASITHTPTTCEVHAPTVPVQQHLIYSFTPFHATPVHPVDMLFFPRTSRNRKDQQASQLTAISSQSSFNVISVRRPHLAVLTDVDRRTPLGSHPPAPRSQPQIGYQSDTFSSSTSVSHQEHLDLRTFYNSSPSSSTLYTPSPSQSVENPRYYAQALSDQDKHALSQGELNHNLKTYSLKDAIVHHDSRTDLVPRHGIDKLDKMEAHAHIVQERERSRQLLERKVRGSKYPKSRLSKSRGYDDHRMAYRSQASQSMYGLRSSSVPPQQPPPVPAASFASPSLPRMTRQFSFVEDVTPVSDSTPPPNHLRAASTVDYFTHPVVDPITRFTGTGTRPPCRRDISSFAATAIAPRPSTTTPVASSSRADSPLSKVVSPPQHEHNPNVTFDSFLVPHKSGKGEAFQGTSNAKKPKVPKGYASSERNSSPESVQSMASSSSSSLRYFGKLPVQKLLGRSSRRNLCKDDEYDVSSRPRL